MSGRILFSTFSPERRSAIWAHCRAEPGAWWLIVPSAAQVGLVQRSFPKLDATFGGCSALDGFAVDWVLRHEPGAYVVSEAELFGLAGEVLGADGALVTNRVVMQIQAWQEAGLFDAALVDAAGDPDAQRVYAAVQALCAQRLGTTAVQTATWAKAHLATKLAHGGATGLPKLLLEGFLVLSPVEERLVQALTGATDLLLRLYDVHDASPLDSLEQALVESIVKAGTWSSADPDPLPSDFQTVQLLAERLFGNPATELPADVAQKRFRVSRLPTLAKQLVAIVDAARRAWDDGAARSNTIIGLPDSAELRVAVAALFAGLDAPLRWSAPHVVDAGRAEGLLQAARTQARPPCTGAAAVDALADAGERLHAVAQTIFTSRALASDQLVPWSARVGQLLGLLACPETAAIGGSFAEGKVDVVSHRDLLGRAGSATLLVVDADGQAYPAWHGGFGTTARHVPAYLVHACKVPAQIYCTTSDAPPRPITDALVERLGAGPFSSSS